MSTELYRLRFPNGKLYIGVSHCSRRRYKGHAKAASNGSDLLLSRAWRKYGAPELTVLAVVEDGLRGETESRAVATFKTFAPFGYNMTPGGEIAPTTVPEIAAKVSKKLLGKKKSVEHCTNIAKGKSKQMLDYFKDPEARAQQSKRTKSFCDANPEFMINLNKAGADAKRGTTTSDEIKSKMAEARRLHWANLTPEQRADREYKCGNGHRGKSVPQEQRDKQSVSMIAVLAKLTKEQLSERSRKSNASMTAEERSAKAQKIWDTRRQRGTDCWANK